MNAAAGRRRESRYMLAIPVQSEATPVYSFDARGVAKRLRQPAVLAALDALRAGETMRLTSEQDPATLLEKTGERYAKQIAIRYVERDGDRVVIDFTRL
jgi:uncharacterized protein (DUF2249 family)